MMFCAFIPASLKLPEWSKWREVTFLSILWTAASVYKIFWCFAFKIFCNLSSSDCETVKNVASSVFKLFWPPPLTRIFKERQCKQPLLVLTQVLAEKLYTQNRKMMFRYAFLFLIPANCRRMDHRNLVLRLGTPQRVHSSFLQASNPLAVAFYFLWNVKKLHSSKSIAQLVPAAQYPEAKSWLTYGIRSSSTWGGKKTV